MLTVKSMEFPSFILGLISIIASLFVLGGPRPDPDVLPESCLQWRWTPAKWEDFLSPSNITCLQWGPPSAKACVRYRHIRLQQDDSLVVNCQQWAPFSDMTCLDWQLTPEEDFTSFMTCLQLVISSDDGFSDIVDKALGFPHMVLFTSVIHVLANLSLLFGVYQSNSFFMMVFIFYYILTSILGFIFTTLLAPYESLLVSMCLFPVYSSVVLLYGKSLSLFLGVFISVIKSTLFFCTTILLLKMDDIKAKAKLASENKMQVDSVFVVPV